MPRWPFHIVLSLSVLLAAGVAPARADDHDDDEENEELAPGLDHKVAHLVRRVDADRIQESVERLAGFGTRNSCSDGTGTNRGVNPARDYIFSQFSQIKGLQVKLDPFVHGSCPTKPTFNVLAWLPGKTHPERLVIIGGHYDSRTINVLDTVSDAPGADDSGAQTANVLEMARALSKERHPDTLVFIAFSGEEQGLFGSGSIARKIVNPAGTDLPDLFKTAKPVAMLNNDIPGGDNFTNGPAELQQFRLFAAGTPRETGSRAPDGTPDNTSPSRGLMRYVATWGAPYLPSMQALFKLRNDRPGRSSDQRSFTDNSVPAVRFMETRECSPSPFDNSGCTIGTDGQCTAATVGKSPWEPLRFTDDPKRTCLCFDFGPSCTIKPPVETIAHQHSPFDQTQFVTAEYAARIAKIMVATASSLARAPLSPTNFAATGNATAGAALTWTAPAGDDVHHYVIAARATTENFYGQRVSVKAKATARVVTPAELGLTAGQSFFVSVAAVDAKGHESLFAYPEFRCDATACAIPPGALDVTASCPPPAPAPPVCPPR